MNIGGFDRLVRLLTGLGVVLFDYISSANWEIIFLVFGTWSVLTSVFGWCPFYKVFGLRTCPATFNVEKDAQSVDLN
tara:strand:- start:3122 stop:3352 length:231 start_codon:yes stop_codon:yes gene_type:complete